MRPDSHEQILQLYHHPTLRDEVWPLNPQHAPSFVKELHNAADPYSQIWVTHRERVKGKVKSEEKEGEMSGALKKNKEVALFLKVRKRCWLQDRKSCSTLGQGNTKKIISRTCISLLLSLILAFISCRQCGRSTSCWNGFVMFKWTMKKRIFCCLFISAG